MEKPMTRNVQKTLGIRVALAAAVAFPLIIAMSARAQEPAPPPPTGTNVAPAAGATAAAAELDRADLKSRRLKTSHSLISYANKCLKKKNTIKIKTNNKK